MGMVMHMLATPSVSVTSPDIWSLLVSQGGLAGTEARRSRTGWAHSSQKKGERPMRGQKTRLPARLLPPLPWLLSSLPWMLLLQRFSSQWSQRMASRVTLHMLGMQHSSSRLMTGRPAGAAGKRRSQCD